ncbi:MAG: DUF2326 domain-containing protein [Candidatus Babeliaceae bacterium]|nr:DUF2326 domain-containing protein [Candidatus Babeliaceae bacterium]
MKLSRLYSNKNDIFPLIEFRDDFNVVFARVKDPIKTDRDSHNLGKTFLANLIDFCLLGDLEKDHPFKERPELFADFIFFLEIVLVDNTYITVKRKTSGKSNLCLHISSKSMNLASLPDSEWEYSGLSIVDGREKLNRLLNLDVIKPFDYRKGITYFLRRQADYNDVFQISKFAVGKHRDWKPYMAQVLGLNRDFVQQKYDLDEEIEDKENDKAKLAKKAGVRNKKYDEIKSLIEIKSKAARKYQKQLDDFSFFELEADINDEVIRRIEKLISDFNQERYLIDYELQEIDNSLSADYVIDAKKMFVVFEDVKLLMPESLVRQYDELVEFNKRLSIDRQKKLKELKVKLSYRKDELDSSLRELDNERQKALNLLKQKETLQKYKSLQGELLSMEKELLDLQQQLTQLDEISVIEHRIEELKIERSSVIHQLSETLKEENSVYSNIRQLFSQYVEEVLSVPAALYTDINAAGNLDFKSRVIDKAIGQETYQWKGTSYQKILCACFDLAILCTYSKTRFYKFVYHDGIFEGLDNRKKVKLLNMVRNLCHEYGIQYILTVIDSDLPRDDKDNKLLFDEKEIIRLLQDSGDEGRLFRMPIF